MKAAPEASTRPIARAAGHGVPSCMLVTFELRDGVGAWCSKGAGYAYKLTKSCFRERGVLEGEEGKGKAKGTG
jgi:hypothetical protein